MRIWITNTAQDQNWQSGGLNDNFDFSTNGDSSFQVKMEGRLLDDGDDDESENEDDDDGAKEGEDGDKMDTDAPADAKGKAKEIAHKNPSPPRFSHFFKAITVDMDRTKIRNGAENTVEWKKPERTPNSANPPAAAEFDELKFKRFGDENLNITIKLYRDETPERFQLSPELSDLVDLSAATRSEVVMGLWEYIKMMGLQEDEEKRQFRCDEMLRKV